MSVAKKAAGMTPLMHLDLNQRVSNFSPTRMNVSKTTGFARTVVLWRLALRTQTSAINAEQCAGIENGAVIWMWIVVYSRVLGLMVRDCIGGQWQNVVLCSMAD